MKQNIHPEYTKANVICNGCSAKFETRATVDKIEVEICSQCHPFYTGKQKLVDVAGRVDRFRARQAAAGKKEKKRTKTTKAEDRDEKTTDSPPVKKSLSDLKK